LGIAFEAVKALFVLSIFCVSLSSLVGANLPSHQKPNLSLQTKTASFKVKNMACQSCANHLTTILAKTKGVVSVDQVDFKTGNVAVSYDPQVTNEQKIKQAIDQTPYRVVTPKPSARKPA
jgi:copper chaperone CopZ